MASERKIAGRVVRFDPITGWEAFDALDLLMDVIGPLLPMIDAATGGDEEERTKALTNVLGQALKGRDREAIRRLMEMLIGACRYGSDQCVVGVFPQSLSEMIAVATFAGEVQFGSFFDGDALAGLGRLVPKGPTSSAART